MNYLFLLVLLILFVLGAHRARKMLLKDFQLASKSLFLGSSFYFLALFSYRFLGLFNQLNALAFTDQIAEWHQLRGEMIAMSLLSLALFISLLALAQIAHFLKDERWNKVTSKWMPLLMMGLWVIFNGAFVMLMFDLFTL